MNACGLGHIGVARDALYESLAAPHSPTETVPDKTSCRAAYFKTASLDILFCASHFVAIFGLFVNMSVLIAALKKVVFGKFLLWHGKDCCILCHCLYFVIWAYALPK